MDFQSLRREIKALFLKNHIDSPDADSGLLLMNFFNLTKTQLILDNFEVIEDDYNEIRKLVARRINGEPIQYIIGKAPFMELEFSVNPSTLIPRSDTELLVEIVSKHINTYNSKHLWDIGCGSGCVGISLAHIHHELNVTEIDISKEALDTAYLTAKKYNLDKRISFIKHDILSGMPDLPVPDIIVSNPPYIPTNDIEFLQKEVKIFEPISALDGGNDGLTFYRYIIKNCPLKKDGFLAFEIGYDQGESVPNLMRDFGFKDVRLYYDISNNPRVVTGIK